MRAALGRLGAAALRLLPPEAAHDAALAALKAGLVPAPAVTPRPSLATRVFGLDLPNPIGLAAGFDKSAVAPDALLALGFGFVEVGTVTPLPQPGNPKPRLFRLGEDRALINRFGFNNDGLAAVVARLSGRRRGILGVNLGRNKESPEAIADYERGVAEAAAVADYLVVNVSSPNTPGLRDLQRRDALDELAARVVAARDRVRGPPLLLKIAPDLSDAEAEDIAEVALARRVDGLIVSNTTLARPPGLRSRHRAETGGLSGAPLAPAAARLLGLMRRLTSGGVPLVAAGGIATGADALARIRAGASLVQVYTAFVYEGPDLAERIAGELAARLAGDGFATVADAIGADA